jgi:hypothetical protein
MFEKAREYLLYLISIGWKEIDDIYKENPLTIREYVGLIVLAAYYFQDPKVLNEIIKRMDRQYPKRIQMAEGYDRSLKILGSFGYGVQEIVLLSQDKMTSELQLEMFVDKVMNKYINPLQ